MNWKQNLPILLSACLLFGMAACKKNASNSSSSSGQTLIENAQRYFDNQVSSAARATQTGNPRLDVGKSPAWSEAYCMNLSRGVAVVVPVYYQKDLVVTSNFNPGQVWALNQLTKLVIWRDSAGYKSELVTAFPDSAGGANRGVFSGIVFVETWQGDRLETYKFSGGRIWRKQAVSGGQAGGSGSIVADAVQAQLDEVSTCYTISGYNYSVNDPNDVYSWTESAGCSTEFLAADGSGLAGDDGSMAGSPGNGASGGNGTATVVNFPGDNIIGNINDYTKCFSNYGGSDHSYQVTICISQPVPGSRTPWSTTVGPEGSSSSDDNLDDNPINAGHTFLIFSEGFSDYSIVRNVGFYPQTAGTPVSPSAQGQLNNDANHTYNISLTVTVTNAQFFNMLNYIAQGNNPGYLYNLSTNNCTSFCLQAMDAGGVVLPATVGSWPGGGFGYDPGNLGEDIRGMTLSSNMARNTNYNAHPNLYTCN